jgi:hypothetical protein
MALFIADALFIAYRDAKDPIPSQVLKSRDALAPVFEALNQYRATTHFVGQSTITALMSDRAAAVTYGLAHHLSAAGDAARMTVAAQRYYDTFAKAGGAWRFAERWLDIDWNEIRALA